MKSDKIGPLENLIVRLDDRPWDAILRVALGFALIPLLSQWKGTTDSGWALAVLFLGLLLLLRLVPALCRKLLRFSSSAHQVWSARRQMAKRYDSYQWQKLFWIGSGIAAYLVLSQTHPTSGIVLAASCLGSGGVGLLVWTRGKARRQQPRPAGFAAALPNTARENSR